MVHCPHLNCLIPHIPKDADTLCPLSRQCRTHGFLYINKSDVSCPSQQVLQSLTFLVEQLHAGCCDDSKNSGLDDHYYNIEKNLCATSGEDERWREGATNRKLWKEKTERVARQYFT